MAERCGNCRKLEERLYLMQFQPRKFHFYKVLTGDFYRQLSIPGKFTKLFEAEMSEVAHLKGPSGYVWHVGLKKTVDGFLFQNGWKEFVEQCSLEPGNLLVFRYDGKFCFTVQIFDGSGCERDYSYSSVNCEKVDSNEGYQAKEKTQVVEILHFSSPYEVHNWTSSRMLERDNPPTPQISFHAKSVPSNEKDLTGFSHKTELKRTKKKKRSGEITIDPENPNYKPFHSSKTTKYPEGQLSIVTTAEENIWCPRWFISNRRPVTDEEKARAVEAARAFKSPNPSFTIVLRASYVYKKCPLAIPTNFAKIYLPRESQSMALRDSSGKTWPVRYTYKTYAGLGSGWVSFAWEQNLEEGDVCVFELVKQAPMIVMEVVIFRVVQDIVPLTHTNGNTPGTKRGRPAKGP